MNKHESTIRAASLVAKMRNAQGDFDMLIEAAEAFASLKAENVRLKTRLADTDVALSGCKLDRDELAAGLGQMLEARSAFMGSRSSSADSFSAFLEAARDVEDATTAILTRRDARMKAEALEDFLVGLEMDMSGDDIYDEAKKAFAQYRKQAEEMGDE